MVKKYSCGGGFCYKAWVERFSCRCGTALKVFPCRLRTKPCRLGSPKRTNKLAGGQEQNPSPQKGAFEGSAHQRYCLLWVASSSTHVWEAFGKSTQFCYPCAGQTSTTTATPHKSGTLILAPSAYKAWVGCFSCRCGIALKVFPCRLRTKPCGLGSPKWTNRLAGGREQNPPPQ